MHHGSHDNGMQACIDACLACYGTCLSMASTHCLDMGGAHAEPRHIRLMLSCAEVCRASAHMMLIGSAHAAHLCPECAEICEACADDCERVGDMEDCVAACRTCAEACRAMAA